MKGHPIRELEREMAQGYRLEQVVADLVDNSIDAGANQIQIAFAEEEYIGKQSHYLIVSDDGKGIAEDALSSIMDFGATRVYDELDLGKFGVGLKSSSLSQAQEITVLSKVENEPVHLRRLSASIVREEDAWVLLSELRPEMKTSAIDVAYAMLNDRPHGTVVVLEDMHKLDLQVGHQSSKKEYLNDEHRIIREYLSMVFEQYLSGVTLLKKDGSKINRQISISYNGPYDILTPLDPFLRELQDGTHKGTLSHTVGVEVDHNGTTHKIPVVVWILPYRTDQPQGYQDRITNAARGISIRELQGIYFYRNARLVDFPGWRKLLKLDEHISVLRWEVHFPPSLDDMMQLDPSKREIQVPRQMLEGLSKIASAKRRWHPTDEKAVNHRKRARERNDGKDNKRTLATPPSGQQTSSTSGGITTQSTFNPTGSNPPQPKAKPKKRAAPQAAKKVRIKSLHGTPAGNLVVLQSQEGDELVVTLNTNHAMYQQFIEKIRSFEP